MSLPGIERSQTIQFAELRPQNLRSNSASHTDFEFDRDLRGEEIQPPRRVSDKMQFAAKIAVNATYKVGDNASAVAVSYKDLGNREYEVTLITTRSAIANDEDGKISITQPNGQLTLGEIDLASPTLDYKTNPYGSNLAIVRIRINSNEAPVVARVARSEPEINESPLIQVGFPEKKPVFALSVAETARMSVIETSLGVDLNPGNSDPGQNLSGNARLGFPRALGKGSEGGGIFDAEGRLVAIASQTAVSTPLSTNDGEEVPYNSNAAMYGIHWEDIASFLNAVGTGR